MIAFLLATGHGLLFLCLGPFLTFRISLDTLNSSGILGTIQVSTPSGAMTMTKSEMETYRESLVAMRDRHNGDVSHLADEALRRTGGGAAGNLSNMPIHMADLGTDNFEQEFTLSLLKNEEQLLEEISAALERIKQGTFGQCEECQGHIPKARLQAVPYARYCVDCARKIEHNS
jgi:RNA polymerase-binding transcription factor DksA